MSPETKTDAETQKNSSWALIRRLVVEYVRPYFGQMLFGMFWMAVAAASTAANAWLMEPILDEDFLNKDRSMLMIVPAAILAIAIIKGISTFLQGYISGSIGQKVIADVQKALYAHLMHADLAYFQAMASGKLVSNFLTDANMLREAVSKSLTGMVKDTLTASFLISLMFYQDWRLALATFFVLPVAAIPVRNMGRRLRKASVDMQERTGLFSALLTETLQGAKHVKTYAMEGYESKRANAAIEFRLIPVLKSLRTGSAVSALMEALGGVAIAVVVFYGGNRVIDGETSAGAFFSFIAALLMAYQPIKSLANLNSAMQGGLGAAERIFAMLDHAPDIADKVDAQELTVRNGEISFRDVQFDYADGTSAINGVSFEVPAGSVVALVGASGSGKSTMMNLIGSLDVPTKGRILLDNEDISTLSESDLAQIRGKKIGFIFQSFNLINNLTAKENVMIPMIFQGYEVEDRHYRADELMKMVDLSDRKNHSPNELSGGQQQRVAIARALANSPEVILADEPTGALDSTTTDSVMDLLKDINDEGMTVFVITHEEEVAEQTKRIVRLKDGIIISDELTKVAKAV